MVKRIVSLSVAITILIVSICGRIGYIIFSNNYTVLDGYNSYTLTIDNVKPTLYYSNADKMTNNKFKYVAVIRPNQKCLSELYKLFSYSERQDIVEELKKGYPVIKSIDSSKKNSVKYISVFKIYDSQNYCSQLISTNSSGLYSYLEDKAGSRKINFSIDAKGRLLEGDTGEVVDDNYNSIQGLKLTIDKSIQEIVYNACKDMQNGCVIVMRCEDASIAACVTKPDSSYINKPFEQYSVGSVFKIIVAASALENDVKINYTCNGSINVGDTVFSCQSNHIHGKQNLKLALANSCNCYFVNLALTLGADKLLKTASDLGFNNSTELYNNWIIKNASLPSENTLLSKGQLSLLGFGQGELTASPLQICSTLCTIGNKGFYNKPRLVYSTVDNYGLSSKIVYNSQSSVLNSNNCDKLISYLRYVVTNGTASNSESSSKQSAGKTATAQTGQYIAGEELLNTWFAGLYPYSNPKYAIVVMTENGTSGAEDCCPIYRTIVENIDSE